MVIVRALMTSLGLDLGNFQMCKVKMHCGLPFSLSFVFLFFPKALSVAVV